MHSRGGQQKSMQFKRHRNYLIKLKRSSLYCPRYDMNSLNNNLLLHRNYNPKAELKPRKASQDIRELEGLIKKRMVVGKTEEKEKSRWYEAVLRSNQVMEKRFQFQYSAVSDKDCTVRENMSRIYNLTKQSWAKSKNGEFSSCNRLD